MALITVSTLQLPSPKITGKTNFCEGDSTVLSVAAGYISYRWSTGDTTRSITVRRAGTYTVSVIDGSLCPGTGSITVTVDQLPSPTIGGALFFCNSDSTVLDAGSGYASYRWSNGATTQRIVVKTSDTFSVTVTNAAGCSTPSPAVVTTKYAAPDASISHTTPTTFCPGDSVTLTAAGGNAGYLWSTGEKTQSITVRDSGTYKVFVVGPNGCIDSSSIHVSLSTHLSPEITVLGPTSLCEGDSVTLDAGAGYASDLWSDGSTERMLRVGRSGTFSVDVTSRGGCTGASAPVTITANPKPVVEIIPSGSTSICDGASVVLKPSADFPIYRWSTGETTPSITVKTTGRYILDVTDLNGCRTADTIVVSVMPQPRALAGADVTICPGSSTVLSASGGVSYRWTPSAGLSCTDCANPVAQPERTTTYTVEVTGENGCTAVDQVVVNVRTTPLLVRAHIDKEFILNPGKSMTVPLILDDTVDASVIRSLDFSMKYDSTVLRLDNGGLASMFDGTLCGGWKTEVTRNDPGIFVARLLAPQGARLKGIGPLMNLEFTGFLGKASATSIDFNVGVEKGQCTEIVADAGNVRIEVCGVNDRLIELEPFHTMLKQNHPNPFNPSTQIDFSISFDGPVLLQIFDASGREVGRPIDRYLKAGDYTLPFDASQLSSGTYTYRMVYGSFVQTRQMVVVK
jgi:hypothetical protein